MLRSDTGIALINALVIVLALGATSQLLLSRAIQTQDAIGDSRDSAQALLYLNAGAVLVQDLLLADWEQDDTIDHLGEIWAAEGYSFPIDRGVLTGRVADLQGRFNVNWLRADDPTQARRALERLVDMVGLDLELSARLAVGVRDAGTGTPGIAPSPDGDLRTVAQLRAIHGIPAEDFDRLAPFLVALPRNVPLNVNTAPTPVLVSIFPTAQPGRVAALAATRTAAPFASPEAFLTRATERLGVRATDTRLNVGYAVTTAYFLVTLRADVDGVVRSQNVALWRDPVSGTTTVYQRRVTQ